MVGYAKGVLVGSVAANLIWIAITLSLSSTACASDRINWVERSLDKTIVTEKGRTYTIPGPRGSGTHVVTEGRSVQEIRKEKRIRERERKADDDHSYNWSHRYPLKDRESRR